MSLKKLSKRESMILKMKMNGMGDKEVAKTLKISYWTVRSYLSRLKEKFECQTILQVVAKCRQIQGVSLYEIL